NPGSYVVEASKDGYVSKTVSLEISRMTSQNFYLLREGEEAPSEIYTYPKDADWYTLGFGENPTTLMGANLFPSSMISPYAGKQIKSISFLIHGESDADGATTTTGTVHALVDYGSERKAFIEVSNPSVSTWNTVDLTDLELIIPEGKDIYAGYALKNWAYDYCLVATTAEGSNIGYYADYDEKSAKWYALSDGTDDYVYAIKLNIGDYVKPDTGYNYINNPKDGIYSIGDSFELNLVETSSDLRPNASGIKWFFDDEPVNGPVRLSSSGLHTVTAKFTTVSGEKKVIDLEITVK
ncbi:MAG: hypothetical protein MJZ16_06375, partial [Bacteroidales bacterium]|nr:hypothetical protein [Bacteroidales bacterium]